MSILTRLAQGADCLIRADGCNCNPETSVGAHYRMLPFCGTGIKPPDLWIAHACSSCHDVVDFRVKSGMEETEIKLAHAQGVLRTIEKLHRQGYIIVKGQK